MHFGPKCAAIAGLLDKENKAQKAPSTRRRKVEAEDGQLDLFAQ